MLRIVTVDVVCGCGMAKHLGITPVGEHSLESSQTIVLFFSESIFFIVVLSACLKFAAQRHRSHLKKFIEQVNKSNILQDDADQERLNNKEMRDRLLKKIRSLQEKLNNLMGIENQYERLKIKYDELKGKGATIAGNSTSSNGSVAKRNVIAVGTTVDRESGVDQNYLNYLAKKKSLNDACVSSARVSSETKIYNKKVAQQRELISSLQEKIKQYELSAAVDGIKENEQEKALNSLKNLEQSLIDSQRSASKLESELTKVKKELQNSQSKVAELEIRKGSGGNKEEKEETRRSYTVISRINEEEHEEEEDPFVSQAVASYDALKKEVEHLRNNTTNQRQMIFQLESQVVTLKNELEHKELDDDYRQEKELELNRLERLLKETEGCVDVLESEVSYLQDKLDTMAQDKDVESPGNPSNSLEVQDEIINLSTKLEKARMILSRAAVVRERLRNVIDLSGRKFEASLLELVATRVLETIEPLSADIHLRITTHFGQVDVANCGGIRKDQLELLTLGLNSKADEMLTGQDGFVVAFHKIGVFARGDPSRNTSIGRLEESLAFILLVSDAIIASIEDRQSEKVRQNALQHLVEGVKKNLANVSIQSKYQRDEAKRIVDNFVIELNSSLNTLNITENQSRFFAEMVDEVRARMEVLFATEVVVDDSFKGLISKLEKGKAYINN